MTHPENIHSFYRSAPSGFLDPKNLPCPRIADKISASTVPVIIEVPPLQAAWAGLDKIAPRKRRQGRAGWGRQKLHDPSEPHILAAGAPCDGKRPMLAPMAIAALDQAKAA